MYFLVFGWRMCSLLQYLMQLFVICRRFLRRNISTTKWRHGDSGLQAGPSCLLAFSWPCVSSTHWVNTLSLPCQTRVSFIPSCVIHIPLLSCACSGLDSCSQRDGVRWSEDLCSVRLLLPVSYHYRSRLAFLQTISGSSSRCTSSPSTVSHSLRVSSQEKRVTSELTIITTAFDAIHQSCDPHCAGLEMCSLVDRTFYKCVFVKGLIYQSCTNAFENSLQWASIYHSGDIFKYLNHTANVVLLHKGC